MLAVTERQEPFKKVARRSVVALVLGGLAAGASYVGFQTSYSMLDNAITTHEQITGQKSLDDLIDRLSDNSRTKNGTYYVTKAAPADAETDDLPKKLFDASMLAIGSLMLLIAGGVRGVSRFFDIPDYWIDKYFFKKIEARRIRKELARLERE